MSDHEEIRTHVMFLLGIRGAAHRTTHSELVQYLVNKTAISKTAARHAINEMVRNKKLSRDGNVIFLPN